MKYNYFFAFMVYILLLPTSGCNNEPIICDQFDFGKLPKDFEFPDSLIFQSDTIKFTFHKKSTETRNPYSPCNKSVFTDCSCEAYLKVDYEDQMGVIYTFAIIQENNSLHELTLFSLENLIDDSKIILPNTPNDFKNDFIMKTPSKSKLKNLKFDKNLRWIEYQDSTNKIWKRIE